MTHYLFGCITFNELLNNAFGLQRLLGFGFAGPEILTGRPKLYVLFTELGLQEITVDSFSIYRRGGGEVGGERAF